MYYITLEERPKKLRITGYLRFMLNHEYKNAEEVRFALLAFKEIYPKTNLTFRILKQDDLSF